MANHASARKRVRRNEKRRQINQSRMGRIRTFIKKVEQAIEDGKAKEAEEALQKAQPELYRGVSKGLVKKNAAARKMSRLSAKIRALKKGS